MYNRYVRNDRGIYEPIPTPEPGESPVGAARQPGAAGPSPFSQGSGPDDSRREDRGQAKGILSGLLSKLKLDHIDSGDLLLLAILFLLFREDADEELLLALGLLLIL